MVESRFHQSCCPNSLHPSARPNPLALDWDWQFPSELLQIMMEN